MSSLRQTARSFLFLSFAVKACSSRDLAFTAKGTTETMLWLTSAVMMFMSLSWSASPVQKSSARHKPFYDISCRVRHKMQQRNQQGRDLLVVEHKVRGPLVQTKDLELEGRSPKVRTQPRQESHGRCDGKQEVLFLRVHIPADDILGDQGANVFADVLGEQSSEIGTRARTLTRSTWSSKSEEVPVVMSKPTFVIKKEPPECGVISPSKTFC